MAKTRFGQLVIGPPGAGKTTYVGAMTQMLRGMGRKGAIVNLDPANENMTYQPDVHKGSELQKVSKKPSKNGSKKGSRKKGLKEIPKKGLKKGLKKKSPLKRAQKMAQKS